MDAASAQRVKQLAFHTKTTRLRLVSINQLILPHPGNNGSREEETTLAYVTTNRELRCKFFTDSRSDRDEESQLTKETYLPKLPSLQHF
ncbi:hypothetical protein V6N11_009849 [Hibiscus sabdariffa]|uniref:Uncharacterized protein n=1 Tax=Hibiscus sabdariffa TaxID=183260 RepID=A0ABR1ZYJ0_9ROSI